MYAYCTLKRDGKANTRQRALCCGDTKPACKPNKCTLQTKWTGNAGPNCPDIYHIITISLHPTTDKHEDEDHPDDAEDNEGENEDKDDSTSGIITTTRVTSKC